MAKFAQVRSAYADECDIESDDHCEDTDRDTDLDLGINIFRKINDDQDDQHNSCADLPVKAEQKVHACAGTGYVAHCEEEAGQEEADAAEGGSSIAVIVADRMQEGHTRQHGDSIGYHHEDDCHQDDRDDDPDHIIAVVRAKHGGCRDIAGADDDTGHDDARADPFQYFQSRELLDALRIKIVCICHSRFPRSL